MTKEQNYQYIKFQDYDHTCFACKTEINVLDDNFELHYEDASLTKEAMYHTSCFDKIVD